MVNFELKENIKTETYNIISDIYNGFMLDIMTTKDSYHAYLFHKNIGAKSLMFGMPKVQQTHDDFINIVKNCVCEYIPDYINEYMNE